MFIDYVGFFGAFFVLLLLSSIVGISHYRDKNPRFKISLVYFVFSVVQLLILGAVIVYDIKFDLEYSSFIHRYYLWFFWISILNFPLYYSIFFYFEHKKTDPRRSLYLLISSIVLIVFQASCFIRLFFDKNDGYLLLFYIYTPSFYWLLVGVNRWIQDRNKAITYLVLSFVYLTVGLGICSAVGGFS